MKKLLLMVFLSISYLISATAQENIIDEIKSDLADDFMIGNYHEGQKYIIAIPPNGRPGSWGESTIRISIASKFDANVNINILGTNHKKTIKAGEAIYLDENVGLSASATECRDPNSATDKTISIEADMPVSVHVINSKSNSTDMYKAIPVEFWGYEYLHCSYYDHTVSSFYKYSGGFLIIASENGTNVNVQLRGRDNSSDGHLNNDPNKTVGDQITISLDKGEVYQIEGNGETKGAFDLTGSLISADKPIGVISYHMSAVIPALTTSSMGKHLSEMMPPVGNSGTDFISLSMKRDGSDKGDLFRMVATEDDTEVTFKWYEFGTKKLIGSKSILLNKAGNFEEYSSVLSPTDSDKSITGISVFTANKPIQIMQYSYTRSWDNSGYDSFMWLVPPTNQYAKHAIVQAPDIDGASDNHLHLIIKTDSTDKQLDGLKSITFNGEKLDQLYPSLMSNTVPGTDYYWAQIPIASGYHEIEGDGSVEFGAYVQSKSSFTNYGSAAIMAYKPQNTADTMSPKISYINEIPYPKIWKIRIEENQSYPGDEEDFTYIDTKVWFKPLTIIDSAEGLKSVNFKEPYTDFEWKFEGHDDYVVNIEVDDSTKYAEANFYVADYVGNIAIGQIKYFPNSLSIMTPEKQDFGQVPVNETKTATLTFQNSSEVDYTIRDISLVGGQLFTITNSISVDTLKKNAEFEIEITYSPIASSADDKAVLTIETDNLTHTWEVTGSAFSDEEILVFEGASILDFGTVIVDESKDKSVNILNNGLADINIESISLKSGEIFTTTNANDGSVITPGNSLPVSIKYAPVVKSDLDTDTLIVKTTVAEYTYPMIGKSKVGDGIIEATDNLIKISPNPLQSEATVTLNVPNATQLKAKLFGAEGQLVKVLFEGICNKGEKALKLDASALASGSYTLVIEFDNQKFAKQILIAK